MTSTKQIDELAKKAKRARPPKVKYVVDWNSPAEGYSIAGKKVTKEVYQAAIKDGSLIVLTWDGIDDQPGPDDLAD